MKRKQNGKKWGLPGLAAVLLVLMGCVSGAAPTAEAQEVPAPQVARFADVTDNAWYATSVYQAAKSGLMVGVDGTHFAPDDTMTAAQAVTMAARLHRQKLGDGKDFSDSSPWYQSYVDYARKSGLLTGISISNYDQPIRRSQVAALFARSLPKKELSEQNRVTCLPDVDADHPYAPEIFSLYRAGVLTGNDSKGTFAPDDLFTRAQAAAIAVRLQNPGWRKQFQLNIVDSISREQRQEINWLLNRFIPSLSVHPEEENMILDRENLDEQEAIWWGVCRVLEDDYSLYYHRVTYHGQREMLKIDANLVDEVIQRYLGATVQRQSVPDEPGSLFDFRVAYEDGYYYMPGINGAPYLALVREIYDTGDGRLHVVMSYFWTDMGMDSEQYYYGCTYEEATALFAKQDPWYATEISKDSEAILDKGVYQGESVYRVAKIRIHYPG